jgi:hypothetical protein
MRHFGSPLDAAVKGKTSSGTLGYDDRAGRRPSQCFVMETRGAALSSAAHAKPHLAHQRLVKQIAAVGAVVGIGFGAAYVFALHHLLAGGALVAAGLAVGWI